MTGKRYVIRWNPALRWWEIVDKKERMVIESGYGKRRAYEMASFFNDRAGRSEDRT